MESTASIEQFQVELQSWKRELSSSKEEIKSFEKELAGLAAHSHNRDIFPHIEHFQNNFIRQKEVIDELRHDLPDSTRRMESIFYSTSNGAEHDVHAELSDRMDMFRKLYLELREKFRRFEADHLI
jgi:predicted RNase H-like nuclease (RuvC/YqgF family)